MSKYIDADELRKVVEESQDLRIIKDLSVADRLSLVTAFTSLYTMLRYIQPADVEPVQQGKWKFTGVFCNLIECPFCGYTTGIKRVCEEEWIGCPKCLSRLYLGSAKINGGG